MNKTKAIIFDCFGVLITDFHNALLVKHGFNKYKGNKVVDELSDEYDRGEINEQGFLEGISKEFGLRDTVDSFWEGVKIDQQMVGYIEKLKKDYKIGLLTNANHETFDQILKQYNLERLFDAIVVSSRVGYIKPEKEIYKICLEKLGLEANECVFVDDDERNVKAAEALGMKGLLYQGFAKLEVELPGIIQN